MPPSKKQFKITSREASLSSIDPNFCSFSRTIYVLFAILKFLLKKSSLESIWEFTYQCIYINFRITFFLPELNKDSFNLSFQFQTCVFFFFFSFFLLIGNQTCVFSNGLLSSRPYFLDMVSCLYIFTYKKKKSSRYGFYILLLITSLLRCFNFQVKGLAEQQLKKRTLVACFKKQPEIQSPQHSVISKMMDKYYICNYTSSRLLLSTGPTYLHSVYEALEAR